MQLSLDFMDWRPAPGFPGYEVSEDGQVRRAWPGKKTWPGKLLKPKWHRSGYPRYCLTRDGRQVLVEAHVLVALAFIGPSPFPGAEVAHEDGRPRHNHYTNLRWTSHQANEADKSRHGTSPAGERNGQARLTAEQVRDMRRRHAAEGLTLSQLGAIYRVSFQTVSKIIRRQRWAHLPP